VIFPADTGRLKQVLTKEKTVLVGVPKETKNNENRVAMTPAGAQELVSRGHRVLIEASAGVGSGFSDADYQAAGAEIAKDAAAVWSAAEMIVKVKEPIAAEYSLMRKGQTLFTYLHLAASRACTDAILNSGTTAIAYETVQLPNRMLPLLQPMSEVAGRLSAQIGANQLMKTMGGRGLLMGGVPGTPRAKVVVIGGGVAGTEAARVSHGMGADVVVIDLSLPRLREIENMLPGVQTRVSTAYEISNQLKDADLVIGSVLIPGEKAPKLVSDQMVKTMKAGSVLVDIAIDQGGCFEGSRPTTHDDPTFSVHQSIYYCVANMPGAVPATSTVALTNATLPYVLAIAGKGWKKALQDDAALALGLNAHEGVVTHPAVQHAFPELAYKAASEVISAS
jgi:alanine dehydrogenase